MISNIRPRGILASLIVAAVAALFAPAPLAAQGSTSAKPTLDYDFFKTQVQPIFLKKRAGDHARCYVCHETSHHNGRDFFLERLADGASSWTEQQSRANFQVVSKLVIAGNPLASLLALMPLAPEVGGIADTHQGGRQFRSQDDPDWKTIAAWIRGEKAGGSSSR
jgi:hypothetical protein